MRAGHRYASGRQSTAAGSTRIVPSRPLQRVCCFRAPRLTTVPRGPEPCGVSFFDRPLSRDDDEEDCPPSSSGRDLPIHPELADGEDYILLPSLSSFTQQPSGWIRWDQPRPLSGDSQTLEDLWDLGEEDVSVPPPSNTPTCEGSEYGSSMTSTSGVTAAGASAAAAAAGALRRDIWTLTDQPGIDMFLAGPLAWGKLKQVFVILFGVGERDTEGIYSLRAFSEDGLPQETIIAFESEEDAQRYAGLLEATMDHLPNVCSIPPRELLDFCLDHGYNCRLEPQDSLLIPPDYNVGVTDWERSLRLREGKWAVLQDEPDRAAAAAAAAAGWLGQALPGLKPQSGGTALANLRTKTGVNSSTLARYTGMSDFELDNIRARLERLLPSDK